MNVQRTEETEFNFQFCSSSRPRINTMLRYKGRSKSRPISWQCWMGCESANEWNRRIILQMQLKPEPSTTWPRTTDPRNTTEPEYFLAKEVVASFSLSLLQTFEIKSPPLEQTQSVYRVTLHDDLKTFYFAACQSRHSAPWPPEAAVRRQRRLRHLQYTKYIVYFCC